MKPALCPVCNGRGVFSEDEKGCHGCQGKGWVEVTEDIMVNTASTNLWDSNKCPSCGGDRNSPAGTGCPKGSHYGSYCEA